MTTPEPSEVDPAVADAIGVTVRDYFDGWFEGDVVRMRRAVHPELVKRRLVTPTGVIDADTASSMVDATAQGVGTHHDPGLRRIDVSIDHVHGDIANVHVTGEVYVEYLHLVRVDGRWQILDALWAPAHEAQEEDRP